MSKPTVKMLNYAHNLAEELRIEDNYNWQAMDFDEGELERSVDCGI